MSAPQHSPALSELNLKPVLEDFYRSVRHDDLLGPVFSRAISDKAWPEHLRLIGDFWSSVMLKTGRYRGKPFSVHQAIEGMRPELFDRWLALFREACDRNLPPALAEALHGKAVMIAGSFRAGLFFQPGRRLRAGDNRPG
jgi:hemoglobin